KCSAYRYHGPGRRRRLWHLCPSRTGGQLAQHDDNTQPAAGAHHGALDPIADPDARRHALVTWRRSDGPVRAPICASVDSTISPTLAKEDAVRSSPSSPQWLVSLRPFPRGRPITTPRLPFVSPFPVERDMIWPLRGPFF